MIDDNSSVDKDRVDSSLASTNFCVGEVARSEFVAGLSGGDRCMSLHCFFKTHGNVARPYSKTSTFGKGEIGGVFVKF